MTESEINKKLEEENKLYRTYLENLVKEGVDKIKEVALNIKQENTDRFSDLKEEMVLFKTEILMLKSRMWNRLNFYIMYGLIGLSFIFSLYSLVSSSGVKNEKVVLEEKIEKVLNIVKENQNAIKENKEYIQKNADLIEHN
jgi:hypothetical protein